MVRRSSSSGVDRCSALLMDVSDKLFGCSGEWNLSFAGCGFRSVYYVGALSCFLDHVPQLVHGASRVCGASSGCLVAAALAVGLPIGTHTHTHTLSEHRPSQQTTFTTEFLTATFFTECGSKEPSELDCGRVVMDFMFSRCHC